MKDYCSEFGTYLSDVKRVSPNTFDSYLRDTVDYLHFLQTKHIHFGHVCFDGRNFGRTEHRHLQQWKRLKNM